MFNQHNDPMTQNADAAEPIDEGGLRAPPGLTGWRKAWWWFDFIILVKLARLRFVGVLLLIGIIITQWDLLAAYYDKWTHPAGAAAAGGSDVEWFCPMHPTVIRDNGKEKCPVCFMPLSKRKKGETNEEALPAGVVNRVQLSPYRVVLAGVQTWNVDYQPVSKEIKAVGFIEFNERGQRTVSARIDGRIEKLFVNETGRMVQIGSELASIYSPDLVVTVQNLLDAKHSSNSSSSTNNLESAKRRLQLLGIDQRQIEEILTTDKVGTNLTIRSPISGHIIKKYVREGQYVAPGTPLYDVSDLTTVWIQAQVYEDDIEFLPSEQLHSGTSLNPNKTLDITATTRAFPRDVFHGKLSFIFPHVDQNTRTLTIRCEIENPGCKLRPGSTATVTLNVLPKNLPDLVASASSDPEQAQMLEQGQVLAVPENAVIDTGSQTIVYRETIPGTFEGVRVKLGPRMTGPNGESLFPVLDGLKRGERVVSSGSFLVDAETRLNPAVGSIYFGGSGGSKSGQSVTTVRPSTPEDDEAKLAAALDSMPSEDRKLAEAQQFCPVLSESRLGSMGVPVKLVIEGKPVFLCCTGCKKNALANQKETLAKVAELLQSKQEPRPGSDTAYAADSMATDEAEIEAELAKLSDADRKLAETQRYCVVLDRNRLGSMGVPEKILVEGQAAFLCCEGCKDEALADPKKTLARLAALKVKQQPVPAAQENASEVSDPTEEGEIAAALAQLSPEDRKAAIAQKYCVTLDKSRLGSMGPPVKLMIDGQAVFVCCAGCKKKALTDAEVTLRKAARLRAEAARR